jgi:hypothetical protein
VSEVRIARSSKGLKRLNPQQLKEFFRAGIAAGKIEAHAFRLVGESQLKADPPVNREVRGAGSWPTLISL